MGNSIRLLLAKLLQYWIYSGGSSFAENFLSKIVFADFSKKNFQLSNLRKVVKSNFKQKISFVIVFRKKRCSFLKNLILAIGIERVTRNSPTFLP